MEVDRSLFLTRNANNSFADFVWKLIDCHTIMHLCIQITEILAKIFASYDDDKESIKTLYFLALVCKMFHQPARDALWRFQRSFTTLVKMFPEDVWVEREDPLVEVRPLS